jgi:hypothetical protein
MAVQILQHKDQVLFLMALQLMAGRVEDFGLLVHL